MAPAALAQHYMPVEKGAKVEFSVMNQTSSGAVKVRGTLSKISGSIVFDPKHLERSSFNVTLNAATVHTGDAARDKDLKSADFFNAARFPSIHFVSSSVTQDRPGSVVYIINGNLTIKGVTMPARIQSTVMPTGKSYLFRGTMMLNRLMYNVGNKGPVGNDVTVFIEVPTK